MERSQQGKNAVVSSRYQQGASITWQLDLSGAVALAEQAAQQDSEIAVLRLQELQLAVLTQVARHYGDWLGAQLGQPRQSGENPRYSAGAARCR